jgi:DNA-binding MarR family transcriptional regulator
MEGDEVSGKMPLWEKLFILPRNIRGGALRDGGARLARFSLNQLLLLNSLYSLTRDVGGGVPLKTLASELEVTPATASEMVETLVRRGILERCHSKVDRRAVEISLRSEWKAFFRANENDYMRRVEAFFAAQPPEERRKFEDTVDALNSFLEALPREKTTAFPGGEGME